jgi:hypothetical protein
MKAKSVAAGMEGFGTEIESRRDSQPTNVPSQEEIRQRAYEIYVERGGADGRDLADWLQAEAELSEVRR